MSTDQGTARIIPFPLGRRKAPAEHNAPKPGARLEAQAAAVVAGEAWYHEAAIQDAKRSGER
jgi:hypothetical protein